MGGLFHPFSSSATTRTRCEEGGAAAAAERQQRAPSSPPPPKLQRIESFEEKVYRKVRFATNSSYTARQEAWLVLALGGASARLPPNVSSHHDSFNRVLRRPLYFVIFFA